MKTRKQALKECVSYINKDVVVVGGGPAGIGATIGAAKSGADVLLIERWGCLGGMLTVGAMTRFAGFYQHGLRENNGKILSLQEFSAAAEPSPKKLIGGVAEDFFQRLDKKGGINRGLSNAGFWGGAPALDIETCKIVADEYVSEVGAEVLLHTMAVDAIVESKTCQGVIIESKSGRQAVFAKCIVDCSGDADVSAAAEVNYFKGRPLDGKMQPVTLMVRIGNVDTDKVINFQQEHGYKPEKGDTVIVNVLKFHKSIPMKGEYTLPNTILAGYPASGKGEWQLNVTRILNVDATNVKDLTHSEIEGRIQARNLVNYLQLNIPGFKTCYLIETAPQIGVRETRRIDGEYMLNKEDVLTAHKFKDTIARAGAPIDIHNPEGDNSAIYSVPWNDFHDIPYGCLVPRLIDNLLVAGRCVSATHEAIGAIRTTVICMALGHAAGVAAALAVEEKTAPRFLDVSKIQNILRDQGAIL